MQCRFKLRIIMFRNQYKNILDLYLFIWYVDKTCSPVYLIIMVVVPFVFRRETFEWWHNHMSAVILKMTAICLLLGILNRILVILRGKITVFY